MQSIEPIRGAHRAVDLPEPLASAAVEAARMRGVSLSAFVESAVQREIASLAASEAAATRSGIAFDLSAAQSWAELEGRLRLRGVSLCEDGADYRLALAGMSADLGRTDVFGVSSDALRDRLGPKPPGRIVVWDVDRATDPAVSEAG